ncbi:hypothetical protein [Pseudonocardia sp. H11422]|uniref:hypothetical protein n=1 Tax=Pseudonocardia sp. H11422 TaxID=2835866 RepID=UPI001BDD2F4D|nr:hypothetical protein [Pseudonocardia sp. H11422]
MCSRTLTPEQSREVPRRATADGTTFRIARTERGSEFAGPVYSRNGHILFADPQDPGRLYAITGPWASRSGAGPEHRAARCRPPER